MSKKALILNKKVVDITDKEFEVHKSMTWVDATDAAEVGGSWDGTKFGPVDTRTDNKKASDSLQILRRERDKLLKETDYWALSDTDTITSAQTTYRQALRDITKTYSSMDDDGFAWPEKPA